jgi:DNA-binding transcriptional regulator LsrR (DeoR family)
LKDEVLFSVSQAFLNGQRAPDIAREANQRFGLKPPLTRQAVYKLLVKAREKGFLQLVVPQDEALAASICQRFDCDEDTVHVVSTLRREDNEQVAARAAEIVLDLIKELAQEKEKSPRFRREGRATVGLGLGPGRATLDLSRHLSNLIRAEIDFPNLKLFAISAGCPAKSPEYSSVSFFNLFPERLVAGRVGLFAQALVAQKDFQAMRTRGGVGEAFKNKEEIDIIVNSMGDVEDEHDLLMRFLKEEGVNTARLKRRDGWVANVQYRPYGSKGPIKEGPNDLRAVTLFELEEFATWAQRKGKHVVLIARQCALCGRTRAAGLLPLLTVPGLRVFDRLVLDAETAKELLRKAGPKPEQAVASA